jgi:hypothetical protein
MLALRGALGNLPRGVGRDACWYDTRTSPRLRIRLGRQFPHDTATMTALEFHGVWAFTDRIGAALLLGIGGLTNRSVEGRAP